MTHHWSTNLLTVKQARLVATWRLLKRRVKASWDAGKKGGGGVQRQP